MNATAVAKPTADVEEIRRALNLLTVPGSVVEIRGVDIPTKYGKPIIMAGYFNDLNKAAKAAVALNAREPAGVYIILNEITPRILAWSPNLLTEAPKHTTGDGHIIRRRWLPLDFGPVRPAGLSSTDAEHDAAKQSALRCRDYLREDAGWPDPILADSGNGWHLLYSIDLPPDDGGLVENCIKAIAAEVDTPTIKTDLSVFNPSRIFKLYGTVARKAYPMPDEPHRVARLVEIPSTIQVVPKAKLEALAAMVAKPAPTTSANDNGNGKYDHRLDVPRWLTDRGHGFKVKDRPNRFGRTVYILDTCPFDSSHGGSGEVSVMQGPDNAFAAACMHNSCTGKGWQEFKKAIGKPDGNHYDPPYPDHQGNGQASDSRHETTDQAAGDNFKPIEFRRITCKELDAGNLDLEYLIDGALVARQPCILAGGKKTLKTSLLIDLGISLAMGGHFLGRLKVNRAARVGIMTGESGLATIQETARRIATAAGLSTGRYWRARLLGRLAPVWQRCPPRGPGAVHQGDELEVIAVDPAYMCIPDVDHSSIFGMGPVLRGVSQVCQEHGALLLICPPCEENQDRPVQPDGVGRHFMGGLPRVCASMVACRPAGNVSTGHGGTSVVVVCRRFCRAQRAMGGRYCGGNPSDPGRPILASQRHAGNRGPAGCRNPARGSQAATGGRTGGGGPRQRPAGTGQGRGPAEDPANQDGPTGPGTDGARAAIRRGLCQFDRRWNLGTDRDYQGQ